MLMRHERENLAFRSEQCLRIEYMLTALLAFEWETLGQFDDGSGRVQPSEKLHNTTRPEI